MTDHGVSGFAERLRIIIGDNVSSFARKAGVPEGSLRQYLAGSLPGIDKAARIASAGEVSLDWLIGGHGPMTTDQLVGVGPEFALLPRYSVAASAGQGLVTQEEVEVERIAFRLHWLREMGLDPKKAGLLTAQGDSMHPTIPDGALMLVDRREDQPIRTGYIYVIVLDGEVLVKRVSRNTDKTIDLISDNPLYPIKNILQTEFDGLFIAGRVFWVGRKL